MLSADFFSDGLDSMAIDWARLRPWNGNRQDAFEELCCQLASYETVPADARFFRKGTPDAGVECFWRMPNGDEWAWQAKFFTSSPAKGQWSQIDESVQTALSKHPRLTQYIVCLAVNLPDARIENQNSALDKWEDHVRKWEKWAEGKGISVAFEYWDESKIGGLLSDKRHQGRHWFWFDEERLSNSWFADRTEEAIANASDRYTPDLNVNLPIRSCFDVLARTPAFFERFASLYSEAHIRFNKIPAANIAKELKEPLDRLVKVGRELFTELKPWMSFVKDYSEWAVTRPIPWDDIGRLADDSRNAADLCASQLHDLRRRVAKDNEEKGRKSLEDLDWQLHRLRTFQQAVSEIAHFAASNTQQLSNRPSLLLLGAAGQGKTHLLCDIAKRETDQSRPRIILHGEQFVDAEPWSQIIELLGLNCSRDELLGALEAAAQANNCRVLIFIDALNEGSGNRLWKKHLPGMLTALARSQWLGICVSVRSSYEECIIPEALDNTRIVRVEHTGFAEVAYDAVAQFFQYFNIEPSTPLLLPEFDNPLFLRLFCKSLENEGLTRVPHGLRGITAIFRFFVESIEKKVHPSEACADATCCADASFLETAATREEASYFAG